MEWVSGDFLRTLGTGIPHFRQRKRPRSLGEPRGGARRAGRVASAPVSVPGPATKSPAFWRSPRAPSLPWNSQQVTASLGSDRWGIDKEGPCALPGGGMGPRLSLWGCLRLHLGEFPSCLKVSPAQLFFLQKHSEPRRLLRRQPPLHRPRHLLLPFPR